MTDSNATVAATALPPELAEMQARLEALFRTNLELRRDLTAMRAAQPVLCLRPDAPSLPGRAAVRLLPRARRARDLRVLRGCGLLSAPWYLERYPDVAAAGLDPALHYLTAGAAERRDPGPHFSTGHYLDLYPDIRPPAINPLVHYVLAGIDEGRSIRPGMPHGQPSA